MDLSILQGAFGKRGARERIYALGPAVFGLEREAYDRLSFRHFLGYPTKIPDNSTIWLFRERLIATGKDTAIWEELQRQIDQKGLTTRRGVIQDASLSRPNPVMRAPTPLGAIRRKHGEAAMVPGRRRV